MSVLTSRSTITTATVATTSELGINTLEDLSLFVGLLHSLDVTTRLTNGCASSNNLRYSCCTSADSSTTRCTLNNHGSNRTDLEKSQNITNQNTEEEQARTHRTIHLRKSTNNRERERVNQSADKDCIAIDTAVAIH